MSRNQRIGLVAAAFVVAVVAFVIARSGGDDDGGSEPAAQPAQTESGSAAEETETQAEEAPPPKPEIARIRLRGGTVVGGVKRVEAAKGDTVRILVRSDAPDEIHLHGYDIYEDTAPGKPARFLFKADVEGIFEIESHVAEDAGRDPLIGRLVVQPS